MRFFCLFVFNTEDTGIYFDSHGKYLADKKKLKVQKIKV